MGTELDIDDVVYGHPLAKKELDALRAELELVTHKLIACGVAATHPDKALSRRGAYGNEWDSPQAERVRQTRAERDRLFVLATKHCPRDHHDWQEIRRLKVGVENKLLSKPPNRPAAPDSIKQLLGILDQSKERFFCSFFLKNKGDAKDENTKTGRIGNADLLVIYDGYLAVRYNEEVDVYAYEETEMIKLRGKSSKC